MGGPRKGREIERGRREKEREREGGGRQRQRLAGGGMLVLQIHAGKWRKATGCAEVVGKPMEESEQRRQCMTR